MKNKNMNSNPPALRKPFPLSGLLDAYNKSRKARRAITRRSDHREGPHTNTEVS